MEFENVITAEECMDVMKEYFHNFVSVDWYGKKLEIMKVIPYPVMLNSVRHIVAASFDEDGNYDAAAFEIALMGCIVSAYTNVYVPANVDEANWLLYGSDLVDIVYKTADADQLMDIRVAAESEIEHLLNTNAKMVNAAAEKIVTAVNEFSGAFSGLFDGVSQEDITNLMSAFANGSIDEEKIMNAYIKHKEQVSANA